jgi:hypothetical protein
VSDSSEHTPTGDPLIEQAEGARETTASDARALDLLDIRRIIGLLLAIYGVILLILGLGASDADIEKAADININLWTGVGMLVAAAVFIGWALARPLSRAVD